MSLTTIRTRFASAVRRVKVSEIGASMVEYALLLALIAVICITAVSFLGRSASDKFNNVGTCVSSAGTTTSSC